MTDWWRELSLSDRWVVRVLFGIILSMTVLLWQVEDQGEVGTGYPPTTTEECSP